MSDPSTPPPVSSEAPLESSEDEPSAGPTSLRLALILGLFKLIAVGLLVYLTYFFTMTFAHRTPPAAPLSEEQNSSGQEGRGSAEPGKEAAFVVRVGQPRDQEQGANPHRTCHGADRGRGGSAPGSCRRRSSRGRARPGRDDHNGRGRETREERPVQRQPRLQPSRQLRCPRQPRRLRPACPPSKCIASCAWPVTTQTAGARSFAWPCRPFPTSPTPSGKPRQGLRVAALDPRRERLEVNGVKSRSCCP